MSEDFKITTELYKISVSTRLMQHYFYYKNYEEAKSEYEKLNEVFKMDRFSNSKPHTHTIVSGDGETTLATHEIEAIRICDLRKFQEIVAEYDKQMNLMHGQLDAIKASVSGNAPILVSNQAGSEDK